jgi:D-glycero-D-manno-heptose 1,7-bisphosphate phosphatase
MKLLVLDKDGTLTRTKSGHTFVQHPEDQVLIDGVAEAIAAYTADGWTMAIASNQGGVAAGHKTLEQAIAEMQYAIKLTGICIGMFCPDDGQSAYLVDFLSSCKYSDAYPKYIGTFRKPQGGMLNALRYSRNASLQDIVRTSKGLELLPASEGDRYRYLMVSDRDEDFGAAVNAGFGYMHVSTWLEPFVK